VKRHAHWVTPSGGGRGAGRDVCELLMLAHGTFGTEMQRYY
jgi:3-deoxy-D-manno-octulosonate 8-phosphate phosphatase (KDO 8-P phosphatase)